MAVKYEDYYQVLVVKRQATQAEIQRAYRKLARQYHPDVNKQPGAQDKLARINEAYEVLKDPEKRKRYDALGPNWKAGQEFRPPPGWENIRFEFGGRGVGGQPGGGFSFQPGGQFSDFFETIFGQAGGRGGGFDDLFTQRATDSVHRGGTGRGPQPQSPVEITITLEEAFHGAVRRLELVGPGGRKTAQVKIPSGTAPGSKIRLRGEGVVLKVNVAPHSRFQVAGHDLERDLRITAAEAALGAKVDVETLDGTVALTVPAGSQSGSRLRLRNRGMPNGKRGDRGDLFVRLQISVPEHLNPRQRRLYEQLKEDSDFNPRKT